ncbi:hypothetical protein ACHQM5_002216 [Ranunculus cassubicifolius]
MAFGLLQLLAGKLHFGNILGWVTVDALFLYVVFNILIGYCMLLIVILWALSVFLPQVVFGLAGVFVLWSTRICTSLLVELASCGDEHQGLIAYAFCLILYAFEKDKTTISQKRGIEVK